MIANLIIIGSVIAAGFITYYIIIFIREKKLENYVMKHGKFPPGYKTPFTHNDNIKEVNIHAKDGSKSVFITKDSDGNTTSIDLPGIDLDDLL